MIRILILAANPRDTSPLRLGEEVRQIESKLREASGAAKFEVRSAWAVTPDELTYQLNAFEPTIVHFVGHGESTGELLLEDAAGMAVPLTPTALKVVFANFSQWLQVVVLNACYSAAQAAALATVADAVVGMSDSIGDAAAVEFSGAFYRALGFGRSVDDAFRQGTAAMVLHGVGQDDVPTLTMRDGVDPAKLTLAGESDLAIAIRRAEDRRVPDALRKLLHDGSEFLLIPDGQLRVDAARAIEENHIFLGLEMRQSPAVFVVEVNRFGSTSEVAKLLARRLLPRNVDDYEWFLIKGDKTIATELSLTMANIRSGDMVMIEGIHKEPLWAPLMTPPR